VNNDQRNDIICMAKNVGKKARLVELDYFRGIALLAIVAQHLMGYISHPDAVRGDIAVLSVVWHFINFGVPAFVLISGTALFYNYGNREDFNYKKYLGKRARQILIPYFLWTVFYYYFSGKSLGLNLGQQGLQLLYYFFTGRANYHLWFIVMIFQLYLLYPLFSKLFKLVQEKIHNEKSIQGLIILAFICQLIVNYAYLTVWPQITSFLGNSIIYSIFNEHSYLFCLFWVIYFVFGGIIGLNPFRIREWAKKVLPYNAVLWLVLFFYLLYNYANSLTLTQLYHPCVAVFAVSTMILVYNFCLMLASREQNMVSLIIKTVGKYSFGIYLAHPLILHFITRYLYSVEYLTPTLKFFITFVLTILIITPILAAFKKVRDYVGKYTFFHGKSMSA